MSSENEDLLLPSSPAESKLVTQKQSKISYTRDFLLSFSCLDICKNLPSGLDASILCEFEDGSSSMFERPRSLGGSFFPNPKHGDYGVLPPNRPEGSSSYSRGSGGRWDTRSSGSSDRDGELQSDRESFTQDSGRRFVNPTRHFWQHSEHDGLLGSGAFPRPSGYAGASAPKARGNGQFNRSTEPYQPPRTYKAVPYSRKDGTDSFNDETFGSAECSSEDRVEEERKRRVSFELMRKEQQKALQEKKQQLPDNHREKVDADIIALLGISEVEKSMRNRSNMSDDSMAPLLSQNDPSRSSGHVQAPASKPLVPPGFASALMEKNICMQSSSTSLALEAGGAFSEINLSPNDMNNDQESRNHSAASMHISMQNNDVKSTSIHSVDPNENITLPSSGVEGPKHSVGFENASCKTFGLLDANEVWEDVVNDLSNKKEARSELMYTVNHNHSTSILEKLFGNALSKECSSSSNFVEYQGVKTEEETWSPAVSESSKFAQWFLEEEKKPVEDFSSRDLLSLIVNNEKAGSHPISSNKGIEHIPPTVPSENKDPVAELLSSSATSAIVGIPEQYYAGEKLNSSSGVLTCEDLEQFILAEVNEGSSTLQHSVQVPWLDGKSEEQKADVDDRASQHILSLLQKGPKESISSPRMSSSDKLAVSDVKASLSLGATGVMLRNSKTVHSSEKTLTLEALFGAAFMNELHSVEAPLSVKRDSAGETITNVTQSHGLPLSCADDSFLSSTSNEYRPNQSIHEGNLAALNHTQEAKAHNIAGPWVRYGDTPIEGSKLGDAGFEEGAAEIQLPEEDSLITVGDSLDPIISLSSPFQNANKEELIPEKTVELLNDTLLNAILRDGKRLSTHGLDGPPLLRGPYDMVDSDNLYNHLHGRPSPQFPHQMNQTRPLFTQLDHLAYRNPQMKFMGPDSIHHDPHHPFPTNVIPQHAYNIAGGPQFDPSAHHPMLQHMPIPPNFPVHHPIQALPRGVPRSHPMNHMPGYIPEINNVHSFPLHNRQPNFGGLGMGMPPGIGGGVGPHPEVLERLIEMEMRANSKQIHPAAGGHIPGIYGPDLDMNFRYR